MIFVVALTGFIYPIQGSWEWGAGWLDARFGFSDFAGSTLVHSTGGGLPWRRDHTRRTQVARREVRVAVLFGVRPLPGANLPLASWERSFCGSVGSDSTAVPNSPWGLIADADAIPISTSTILPPPAAS